MTKKAEEAAVADAPLIDAATIDDTMPVIDAATIDGTIPVRVLLDHAGHKVDDVVLLTEAGAAAAAAQGWGDAHPDAVAYAQSLK